MSCCYRIGLALAAVAVLVVAPRAEEKFGAGVSLTEATPVAALLATPDKYVGQTIRVDGVVKAVCEEMGCWMEIAETESGPSVQIKVDDGVIVFPVSAKGKRASAQGVFEKVAPGTAGHEAKAAAEANPQHAALEAVPFRLKATGAVVY